MLATNRDDLVCDLAETYGVLDMEALPVDKLAVLSFGLRDDSRIKMKISKTKVSVDRLILAGCFDFLASIHYGLFGGQTPPKSMYALVSGTATDSGETAGFDSIEDFVAERERIIQEAQHGN